MILIPLKTTDLECIGYFKNTFGTNSIPRQIQVDQTIIVSLLEK